MKKILFLLTLLMLLFFYISAFSQDIDADVIENKKIQIEGEIVYSIETDDKIYYILKQLPESKNKEEKHFIRIVSLSSHGVIQIAIPFNFELSKMRKLLFTSEYCFLFMESNRKSDTEILYKIDLNTKEHNIINSVIDITLYQDDVVLLERRTSSINVNYRDIRTPTTIKENIKFEQILKHGLVIVSNNEYSEIIDFIRSKNVYSYSDNVRPVVPDKYNLIIEIVDDVLDLAKGKEHDMIYYKIFLNGKEVGRTNTGIAGLKLEYTLLCEPNNHHIIKMERWRLDKVSGAYKRENNIMQPDPVKLYVPLNRLMKIAVNYDGKKHTIREFPVVE